MTDELDSCSLGLTDRYNNVLLTLIVTGDPQAVTNQETTLPARPYYARNFLNINESEIYPERYEVEFAFFSFINRRKFAGPDNFR